MRPWGRTSLRWAGSLPEVGESSYCLVLKGCNTKEHNSIYGPRHRRPPHRAISSNLKVECLRRYFLSLGSRDAATTRWAHKPGQTIAANPLSCFVVYTSFRRPFASFTDVSEAFLYANALKAFGGKSSLVKQVLM